MISFLNIYMFCKCFVSALQEPLRHEIPHCGYNTEFSSLGKLYSAAKALEEVAQNDIGMRAEAHVSAPPKNKRQALVNAIRTQSRPNNNVQARNIPCLPPNIQGDNAQVHPHPQGMSGQVRMGGNNPHPQGNNNPHLYPSNGHSGSSKQQCCLLQMWPIRSHQTKLSSIEGQTASSRSLHRGDPPRGKP